MRRKYLLLRRILKIFIPALLTIVLYIIAIFVIILPNIENSFMERKKELVRDLVNSQWHILEYYYSLEESGVRTRQQAQERAIELFRTVKYGPDNLHYFWINDFDCTMIMHPYRSDLEHQNLTNYADTQGKLLFMEFVDTVMKDCEGYVSYIWQWHGNESRLAPKLSYIKGFAPWRWIIGTGVYLEDVEAEMEKFVSKIVKFSAVILIIVTCLSILIVVQSTVADRKRLIMEENLAKSHADYKSLVENINLGVFRTSIPGQGKFIKVNSAMARLCGYDSVEELMSLSPLCLYPDPQRREHFIAEVIRENGFTNKELRLKKKDGALFWALLSMSVIRDKNGNVQFLDGVVEDITERKKMTAEKEELLKTLATKNEELESIIYVSSHDLRAPLINIQGFRSELEKSCTALKKLLPDIKIPDAHRENADQILNNNIPDALHHIRMGISKIGNLIDGLLILSQINSIKKVNAIIDMDNLIRLIVEDKKFLFVEQNASVVIEELPPCKGNFGALKDVFSNLIDNAIHFRHPDRPVRIHISGKTENSRVVYCVEDNGIGIKTEYQQKIFDVFQKLQPHSSASAGEGLGLTIAKRILDRLNGTIYLESEYDKFTRFYVSLPA